MASMAVLAPGAKVGAGQAHVGQAGAIGSAADRIHNGGDLGLFHGLKYMADQFLMVLHLFILSWIWISTVPWPYLLFRYLQASSISS